MARHYSVFVPGNGLFSHIFTDVRSVAEMREVPENLLEDDAKSVIAESSDDTVGSMAYIMAKSPKLEKLLTGECAVVIYRIGVPEEKIIDIMVDYLQDNTGTTNLKWMRI